MKLCCEFLYYTAKIVSFFLHSHMLFSWFSQGAWRKITVTHYLPLRKKPQEDTDGGNVQSEGVREGEESLEETREVLLPRTANTCELWPAIITKAILKVAALEYVYTHVPHTCTHIFIYVHTHTVRRLAVSGRSLVIVVSCT